MKCTIVRIYANRFYGTLRWSYVLHVFFILSRTMPLRLHMIVLPHAYSTFNIYELVQNAMNNFDARELFFWSSFVAPTVLWVRLRLLFFLCFPFLLHFKLKVRTTKLIYSIYFFCPLLKWCRHAYECTARWQGVKYVLSRFIERLMISAYRS